MRLTDFEPNRRLAFDTISGAFRPSAVNEFSAVSENATEVCFRMTWKPTGPIRLAAPLLGPLLARRIRANYANLVRHLEGPAGD